LGSCAKDSGHPPVSAPITNNRFGQRQWPTPTCQLTKGIGRWSDAQASPSDTGLGNKPGNGIENSVFDKQKSQVLQ
jgi:hypothetical protein